MVDRQNIDAVILCAGVGRRLAPLTSRIPKVLVPVGGEPLLAYHMRALRALGFSRAILVVGYRSNAVRDYVASHCDFGLQVLYCEQPEPCGTGDAVRRAVPMTTSDPFLVIYGDIYTPSIVDVLLGLVATLEPKIVAARVKDAGEFGRIVSESRPEGDFLVRIVEKDGRHLPGLVNAGLYLLPRSIERRLAGLSTSNRGEIELPEALGSETEFGRTYRIIEVEDWVDVGSLERLHHAEQLRGRGPPSA